MRKHIRQKSKVHKLKDVLVEGEAVHTTFDESDTEDVKVCLQVILRVSICT